MSQIKDGHDWLTGQATSHPLSDLETARILVARLPSGNSLAALKKITEWVNEIIQVADFSLEHQLDLLDLLDRLAKNHQFVLVPDYLETHRLKKLSESLLWSTSFDFWKAMGDAYLHCLGRFQATVEGNDDFKRRLPLVVGRILRALTRQLKWTLLRYARVEDRLWRDFGRTYLFAESQGFSTRRVTIYPGSHGESTAQEELLKALMLVISAPDGLTPIQQHIAERISAHFGSRFSLHPTLGPGCTFSFDLAMHAPPSRARKGLTPAPLLRFFGSGTALQGLLELTDYLETQRRLPPDTSLRGNFSAEQVLPVLHHLARCWSDTPIARRGKRGEVVKRLTVVPGLVEVHHWLAHCATAGKDEQSPPHGSESWVVVDASKEGYGAVIPAHPGDWVTVGALVGIRGELDDISRVAILRRIKGDAENNHLVGMEMIGVTAIPVELFAAGAKNAADPKRNGEPALLVSREPDEHRRIELVVKPGGIVADKPVQMRFRDRVHLLEQPVQIEQGSAHRRITFRLVSLD